MSRAPACVDGRAVTHRNRNLASEILFCDRGEASTACTSAPSPVQSINPFIAFSLGRGASARPFRRPFLAVVSHMRFMVHIQVSKVRSASLVAVRYVP